MDVCIIQNINLLKKKKNLSFRNILFKIGVAPEKSFLVHVWRDLKEKYGWLKEGGWGNMEAYKQ